MHSDLPKISLREEREYSEPTVSLTSAKENYRSDFPVIDGETERRLKTLMDEVSSSLKLEDIIKARKMPNTHNYSVKPIQTTLMKLEVGGSIEEAKAIFNPEVLWQIIKWNVCVSYME